MGKRHQIKISDGFKEYLLENKKTNEDFEETIKRLIQEGSSPQSTESTSGRPEIEAPVDQSTDDLELSRPSRPVVDREDLHPVDRVDQEKDIDGDDIKLNLKEVLNDPKLSPQLLDSVCEISAKTRARKV